MPFHPMATNWPFWQTQVAAKKSKFMNNEATYLAPPKLPSPSEFVFAFCIYSFQTQNRGKVTEIELQILPTRRSQGERTR